jgi:DNA-binding transcriptional regulator YdaS (Cro superfamily)
MPEQEPADVVREALREAIEKAGGQTALAAAIGEDVKTGHIFYWLKVGSVPEKHCAVIEGATGVSRKRLCPGWARVWPELVINRQAVIVIDHVSAGQGA